MAFLLLHNYTDFICIASKKDVGRPSKSDAITARELSAKCSITSSALSTPPPQFNTLSGFWIKLS